MREQEVHLHEPRTGGHACGAKVPHEFLSIKSRKMWAINGSQVRRKDVTGDVLDLSDEYLGGEWCCTNHKREITCPRCRRIAGV
jgi:hypothetical protein